jgi:acid phosphatase
LGKLCSGEEETMKRKFARAAAFVAAGLFAFYGMVASVAAGQELAAGAKPVFLVNEAAERLPNIDQVKNKLRSYYTCTCDCGCYARDFESQAVRAVESLDKRVAQRAPDEKLALVLDIDETSLSNWEEMSKADFTFDNKIFEAWEEEARAPVLAGTLRLYREARRQGVAIFFITGRPESERAATERNLRTAGYEGWHGLALRGPHPESETTIAYKSAERAKIVAQGYRIVLNAGDQWSDLRGNPEAEISIKYPNPFYFLP